MSLPESIANLNKIAQDINAVVTDHEDLVSHYAALQTEISDLTQSLQKANPYIPTVHPSISLDSIQNCRKHAHWMPWFGQSNHLDVGYSSQSPDTIAWQLDQLIAKGIDGVNVLFSGRARDFNTTAATKFLSAADERGLIVSLMIDHEADVLPSDFTWAIETLVSGAQNYWTWNGKKIITVFDDPTPAQIAVLPDNIGLLYRNSSGFSKPRSVGCYGWPAPGNEVAYCANFYQKTAAAVTTGKLVMPHVSPGFTGASWNQSPTFKPTPWRYGQEWLDSIQRVIASKRNPNDVMIATWNDHEEGSGIERSPLL